MKKTITIIFLCLIIIVGNSNAQPQGQWTWMKGDSSYYPTGGGFLTLGVFDSGNYVNNSYDLADWTDLNGNFWAFGGKGSANVTYSSLLEFKPSINEWALIRLGTGINHAGVYGVQNIPDTNNDPGCRAQGVATWVDTSGNLWLFGGNGYDKNGHLGSLGDLWKYNIASNSWTWVAGPDTINDPGHYGTIMVASSANYPPARYFTNCSWTDSNNCLWLFGGFANYGSTGRFSDLWKYDIAAHKWTWMNGPNTMDQPAVYGTMGIPNSNNIPSARFCYSKWKDSHGNFWLFGGSGPGSSFNILNDMWRFNPTTNEWTWMSGTNIPNNAGTGTTHCNPSVSYNPGARFDTKTCWTIGCDNFVLFGGSIDSTTSNNGNDLWSYSVSTNKWTLMSGTLNPDDSGHWGTKLVSSPLNIPPSRVEANGWTDIHGNLWLALGLATHTNKRFSDMWRFVPDTTCPHQCIGSGFEEIIVNKNEVVVYPNPASTILNIHHTTSTPNETLLITDLLGTEVYKEKLTGIDNTISISKWSNGVYFYEVRGQEGSTRGKFVVQR